MIGFRTNSSLSPIFFSLEVYDATGRHVANLVNEYVASGLHTFVWHAHDVQGERLAPGTYFYRIRLGSYHLAGKIILAR